MNFLWILLCGFTVAVHAENWPQWRGPRLDGTSLEKNVPIHWSATSNVVWKAELPGLGHASPIVSGSRIFIVSSMTETQERVLLCLDRATGGIAWRQTVVQSPLEKKHSLNSHASSTPACDGERVFTAFLDRNEMLVAAYSLEGKQQWIVRPGKFSSMHGFCSSPILYKDKVIINGDHDGDGFMVALDRKTGAEQWRIDRPNKTRSYCVPLIRDIDGRPQMVLTGSKCTASYDPNNGCLHWMMDGPTEQFVASPVFSERDDLVVITSGFPEYHTLAIRADGKGVVGQEKVAWRTTRGAVYVPSPVIEGEYFLIISEAGVAHCFETKTGKILWQERMGTHHASMVSASGLVYFLNDKGVMNVVKPGARFESVAQNEIGETTFASPAISDGQMFIRTEKHLFCIGRR
ncbi:MAG: serine/threonine protein kinase [Pedosphaera sp.]|nr:serine/threonine protein kinase [Pedosphaera sp.]